MFAIIVTLIYLGSLWKKWFGIIHLHIAKFSSMAEQGSFIYAAYFLTHHSPEPGSSLSGLVWVTEIWHGVNYASVSFEYEIMTFYFTSLWFSTAPGSVYFVSRGVTMKVPLKQWRKLIIVFIIQFFRICSIKLVKIIFPNCIICSSQVTVGFVFWFYFPVISISLLLLFSFFPYSDISSSVTFNNTFYWKMYFFPPHV